MKNLLAAVAICLCVITSSNAQDTIRMMNVKPIEYNNKLGFAASMISGYGISYEYNASRQVTLELTASVYGSGGSGSSTSSSSTSDSYIMATVGIEVQKNFFVSHDSRFYTLLGLGYWLNNNRYNYNSTYRDNSDYTAGLGLGWEFTFGKKIIFNLEAGYLYRDMNEKGTNDYYGGGSGLTPYTNHSYYLGFGGGIGLYYAF